MEGTGIQSEHGKIVDRSISKELKESYLSYAMSVIVGRAIPDVRDGLKPVHRRILYSMMELGLASNRAHKKSARIVGEVLGKYHPHGDNAVYDSLVRMAQEFSLRYPLVDGQGNFGSIDGDNAAAMRYTEARLSKIAEEMLQDIEKNTVEFGPNFDNTLTEPLVMPSKIPNLLINGSSGIAVGMATNIPTHNLTEVCSALIDLIDNENLEIEDIVKHIKAPDFPTGGTITNQYDMLNIYKTGRGSVHIRGNYTIEENKKGKKSIVFTEIPYRVNKSELLEHIGKLVNAGTITGVSDLRDESDKDGIRVVIEVTNNSEPEFVVNNLFKHSELESSFGVNLLVLNKNKPKLMNIKEVLVAFIEHRIEVTKRWLAYDIDKLSKKLHILEGLMIALQHLDETIEIIKTSKDPQTAKHRLMERFKLDEIQTQAILDMRLQKLTGLEIDSLKADYNETKRQIDEYKSILNDKTKLMNLIKSEIIEIKDKYGDNRRTNLSNVKASKDLNMREFIENKKEIVVLTNSGYIKRMSSDEYRTQNRAGRGTRSTKSEDGISDFTVANTHDVLYLFTTLGRLYTMDCFEIPESSKEAKGRFLANFLNFEKDEKVCNIMAIDEDVQKNAEKYSIVLVTKKGKIKKMPFEYIRKIRASGVRIGSWEDDTLVSAKLLDESNNKILITSFAGKAVLFDPKIIRDLGRTASGVKAMNLDGSEIVSVNIVTENDKVLFISRNGYGKITAVSEFRETSRGAKGVKAMNTENAGSLIKAIKIEEGKELMVVTNKGVVIRTKLDSLPTLSRNTKGVRVIKLENKDTVYDADLIDRDDSVQSGDSVETGDNNE